MLQQVLESIRNMFIQAPNPGNYTVSDGVISPSPSLLDGQRFWIVGSVLNDGVYTWHESGIKNDDDTEATDLKDETWSGSVCALAVPPALISLSEKITAWDTANEAAQNSPYRSENVIGVYSYTKATGGSGAGGAVTWRDVFAGELNRWRKVSF